jgi:hypothetical protein
VLGGPSVPKTSSPTSQAEIQRLIVGNEVGKRGLGGVLSFGVAEPVAAPA